MTETVREVSFSRQDKNTCIAQWSGLDGDDSGKAVDLGAYPDKTAQVFGTFGGGTLTLYGSNDPAVMTDAIAGTLFGSKTASWVIVQDSLGNNFAKAAAGGDVILENYRYYLPVVTGGDGTTSLKCIINGSRSRI